MALALAPEVAEARTGPSAQLVLGVVAVVAGAWLSTALRADQLAVASLAFGLVWVGALMVLADGHPDRFLSPTGLYLVVFGLFHGGLLFSVALRGDAGYVSPTAASWIRGPGVPGAVRMSIVGCVAFTVAVLVVRRRAGPTRAVRSTEEPDARGGRDGFRSFRIGLVGLGCLGLGLLVTMLGIVLGGGLSGGYSAVIASAQGNGLLTYGMLFVGLGAVFAAVGTTAQRQLGLGAFAAFALVAVPLGLRGPVLFVAVTVLAVEVRRGLRLRPVVAVVLAIGLLMVIGVVRESRTQGPGAILHGDWTAGPMDAVGEMGFSLYPTVVVRQWHAQGEPFRHGSTLAAVPLRVAGRLVGPPPPTDDRRLFNVEVLDRVGAIGGSPVAEGFHNFGTGGVVGLMAAIGLVLAALDRRRSTATSDALLAVVMLPLVIEVRNFFAAVPAQVLVGLVLLGLALLVPRRTRLSAAAAEGARRAPAGRPTFRASSRPHPSPSAVASVGARPYGTVAPAGIAGGGPPPSAGRRLIAVMTGTSVLQAGAAAFAALWATRVLGPAPRGVMVLAFTTASMVSLLGGLGTGAAFRGRLPTVADAARDSLVRAYALVTFVGSGLSAILAAGVMAVSAIAIAPELGAHRLVLVVCASTFVQCLSNQCLEAWYAEGHFRRGSWLSVAAAGIGMVGLIVAGAISPTPTAMIVGDLVGEAAVAVVSVVWLRRARLLVLGAAQVSEVRDLVRRGWPTMGVGVGILLVFRADRYVLGAFAGASAVTLYSTAATLAEVTRTVPHALGQVFIRHVAERAPGVSLARTARAALVATVVTGAVVGVVGWVAIPVVFGPDLRDARDYLLLLLAAEVLFCPFFVASRGLVGGGWTRVTGVIGAVGCGVAVVSYLALVPAFGVTGACLASAATYLGLSVATMRALEVRLAARSDEPGSGGQTAADAAADDLALLAVDVTGGTRPLGGGPVGP